MGFICYWSRNQFKAKDCESSAYPVCYISKDFAVDYDSVGVDNILDDIHK